MSLKDVLTAWNNIGITSSTIGKDKLISKYIKMPYFVDATFLALNTLLKFKIRDIQYVSSCSSSVNRIWEVLQYLANKSGADTNDRKLLCEAASIDEETVEAVNRILKGDLRCGAGVTIFRKYIKNIPEHKPMLCVDDLDKFIRIAGSFENIGSSVKKNGVRVWAVVEDKNIKYISRNGKEYPNFNIFDEYILNTGLSTAIFDGEVISRDKDFQKCLSNFRALREADTSIFDFHIFDIVCKLPFVERYKIIANTFPKVDSRVVYLPHMLGIFSSKEEILELLDIVTDEGEEGLVLKTLDSPYEFKRSNYWCKLKKFYTVDLDVLAIELGTGKYSNSVGALICDFNGKEVKVGSGFSDEERKEFVDCPPEKIEVKYKDLTRDKSLWFPTFVRVRDDL